jgi:hypothetical protein
VFPYKGLGWINGFKTQEAFFEMVDEGVPLLVAAKVCGMQEEEGERILKKRLNDNSIKLSQLSKRSVDSQKIEVLKSYSHF